jgi:uncharacterized membrane protein YccC
MKLPTLGHWLFSIKTFCAGILALAVAFWIDLPKPYWALASVYIASQPLAGATLSKALYRAIGTIAGGATAVALTPNLVNAPVLLLAAISLWMGLCLYLSILDRSPRSYAFLLAGYTTAIIVFPVVDAPETIFDVALSRCEEIVIGILCAGAASALVFPSSVGSAVAERLGRWVEQARTCCLETLTGEKRDGAEGRWLKLVSGISEFENLASHLNHEALVDPRAVSYVASAVPRILMLPPILSSISDRLGELAKIGGATPQMRALIARTAACLESQSFDAGAELRVLRSELEAQEGRPLIDPSWRDLLEGGLIQRLREIVDLNADYSKLLSVLSSGSRTNTISLDFPIEMRVERAQHYDHGAALIPVLALIGALAAFSFFWIASAWPEGAAAATFAAVSAGLFGAQDDPAPRILDFAKWAIVATLIAGVYTFSILPYVHGMETLTLVLAPTFLVFGVLIASPATFMIGLPLAVFTPSLMALQELYSADAHAFINSSLATIIGMGFTAATTSLIRPAGAEWRAARYVKANRRALAEAADIHTSNDETRVMGLMFDRLALLAPIAHALDHSMPDALRELRAGFNILEAHSAREKLSPKARRAVDLLLKRIARHYRQQEHKPHGESASAIGMALRLAGRDGDRKTLLALTGLWRALFPDGSPPRLVHSEDVAQ